MRELMNAVTGRAQQANAGFTGTRQGTVTAYDPKTYSVKVQLQPTGEETGWIPLATTWVGNGYGLVAGPMLGAVVSVEFDSGNASNGMAVGQFFNDVDRCPGPPSGQFWVIDSTGSSIKLTNDKKVTVTDGGASDPMTYTSDPVTNLPSDQIYAINPATNTPYAQDIAQSGLSGNGLAALIAQENAAKAAAQQSIAQDANATKAAEGGSMGISSYADGGGIYNLGGYSDGGRLLRGPGDGVSDSIPATIGHKQPARLADGEFVVPARIVSELGNGSTEAGARKLYAMLDRIQAARSKTVGKGNVAKNSRADKHLPA